MIKVYPYKMSSKSSKLLANGLDATRVYPDRNYRPKASHMIINWGSTVRPTWYDSNVEWRIHLNDISAVKKAANKILTFESLTNVRTPQWTTSLEEAEGWAEEDNMVFCRTTVTGRSGAGIVVAKHHSEIVPAPLYTKYTEAKQEYRVHVVNGSIIDFVQKKKKRNADVNSLIRNHENGWVFARNEVTLPEDAAKVALDAIKALELDFGAVDVGFNIDENVAYVYEVNTAPGLEGTTLLKYTQAFQGIYDNL